MWVSLFEPHTEVIRKGKLSKPTEFGRRVKIQEAEAQFITDYDVCGAGQSDRALSGMSSLPRLTREERSRTARAALRWRPAAKGASARSNVATGCGDVATEA
jgi:hypothetical protein